MRDLPEIRKVSLAERPLALELIFADLADDERARHIEQWLANPSNDLVHSLWGAFVDGRLVAAILAQVEPGASALIKLPSAAHCDLALHVTLLKQIVDELERGGVRLARALAKSDQGLDAQILCGAGFRHVCELVYLVGLRGHFPAVAPEDGLSFMPGGSDPGRMARIIERTYVGSLDCPAIETARSADDALAGYRAAGSFDPARWLIVSHNDTEVGCLLLADWPRNNQWELIYMGVVPEARGRGLGVAIVRQAQWLTRCAGRERLVLGVDAANEPALKVYAAAGLIAWDRRSVYVRTP